MEHVFNVLDKHVENVLHERLDTYLFEVIYAQSDSNYH